MTTILLVEDEENYREPLAFNLRKDGFEVLSVADGNSALEIFTRTHNSPNPLDLVLLDLMLPHLSGSEVCRRIRQQSNVPVIMLTAKDSEVDKIVGLEIGADDYITKPYSYRELVARIHAVLRRTQGEEESTGNLLKAGNVSMDVQRHEVKINGVAVAMPLREFELLELFMRNLNRVLTRRQIISLVWGADYVGDTKTLDVHVKRIRAKIERDPAHPELLVTVRGLGYKLLEN